MSDNDQMIYNHNNRRLGYLWAIVSGVFWIGYVSAIILAVESSK